MPSPADLHYISSDVCSEMLNIIAEMEIKKLKKIIQQADCFSVQLDKSVNKHNMDSIFAKSIQLFASDYSMSSWVSVTVTDLMCGANRMLFDFKSSMEGIGTDILLKTKMVGLTIDGDMLTWGKKGGLWALVVEYLGRTPITIWSVAHRSDFAFESIESHEPELHHWLAHLWSLAAYIRSSNIREEDIRLHAQNLGREQEVKWFPMHHEVHFVEHLFNYVDVAIANLDFILMHWRTWT